MPSPIYLLIEGLLFSRIETAKEDACGPSVTSTTLPKDAFLSYGREETGMYSEFEWTPSSLLRNVILRRYEPLQPFIMLALLERLKVSRFLDIGANIGAYTLMASRLPLDHIHAFEANPETLVELRDNVTVNGLASAIEIHGFALSDHEGQLEFGIQHSLSGANGPVGTSIHETSSFTRTIKVECRRLDTVVPALQECIAIKLDVEGHELNVLRGATQLLSRNDILLQVEGHGESSSVAEFLLGFGFRRLFRIGPDHYFLKSSRAFTSADSLETIENAAASAIREADRPASSGPAGVEPVRRRVLPGVTVEFGGGTARVMRALRDRLGGR